MKYYKVNVTMKNGFKYSYTCIGRMLEGMKNSSQGYWTEKIEVVEISEEEHRGPHIFAEEKKSKTVTKAPEKNPVGKTAVKKVNPKFSSLENFFDGGEEAPENKKLKKRV
jgi:hypothetical protein